MSTSMASMPPAQTQAETSPSIPQPQAEASPALTNPKTPEEFWTFLSNLLDRFFALDAGDRPREWFTAEAYMKAYTVCYEYCTLKRDPIPGVPPHMAYFYGESLYRRLDERIQQIFRGIGEVCYNSEYHHNLSLP